MDKAELLLKSILHAAPSYKPCLTCKHSWFSDFSQVGWCGNVPPGKPARPVDEMATCEAWALRAPR